MCSPTARKRRSWALFVASVDHSTGSSDTCEKSECSSVFGAGGGICGDGRRTSVPLDGLVARIAMNEAHVVWTRFGGENGCAFEF